MLINWFKVKKNLSNLPWLGQICLRNILQLDRWIKPVADRTYQMMASWRRKGWDSGYSKSQISKIFPLSDLSSRKTGSRNICMENSEGLSWKGGFLTFHQFWSWSVKYSLPNVSITSLILCKVHLYVKTKAIFDNVYGWRKLCKWRAKGEA